MLGRGQKFEEGKTTPRTIQLAHQHLNAWNRLLTAPLRFLGARVLMLNICVLIFRSI